MSLQMNLEKSKGKLLLSLNKKGINTPPVMDLAFDLDVSGSFDDEHRDGITQDLLLRLVPWGMLFDPDQKMDVFTFSNGENRASYVGEITPENCDRYIQSNIIDKVAGYNGGTDYSFVIRKNLQHFGWLEGGAFLPKKKAGFFASLFGVEEENETIEVEEKRSLVIFVTDGESFERDQERTRRVLAESQNRKDQVYFLLIGISNQGVGFEFLHAIADEFDNTGLVVIEDLKDFVKRSDEEINEILIGDELVEWLKQ
ncbi:MAG: VWA domain-containing protein [Marinoscillum sp.]